MYDTTYSPVSISSISINAAIYCNHLSITDIYNKNIYIYYYFIIPARNIILHLTLCFLSFISLLRSTQIRPRRWLTPSTWPKWTTSRTLTRYCASWQLAAWCRLSIFVLAWTAISTTMALLHPFIHTSPHLLGGMKTHMPCILIKYDEKYQTTVLSNITSSSLFLSI